MSNIWLTSDTHFCHDKPFIFNNRGLNSVDEMNELIVERWNSVVKPEDTVYHLGDIALNDTTAAIEYIKQLNGKIVWLRGNHDSYNRVHEILDNCSNVKVHRDQYATTLKVKDLNFYLSHYPTITANFDQKHFSRHVIAVHGHTHQQGNWMDENNPFLYHGGLDSHNITPVNIDEVIEDVRQKYFEVEKGKDDESCK